MSRTLFGIIVAVIVVGWSLPASITNVNTQKAMAVGATTTNTVIVLQSPLYTEYDKTTSQKTIDGTTHARAVIFSGHGFAKGVNYTDIGEGLITLRGISGIIDSKGQGVMITISRGKASFTFHEIGHSDANGTIIAIGAAFF